MPPQQKRKLPKWLKIILIVIGSVIALLGAIYFITSFATKEAVKVSDKFVAAMQADDASRAYSLISAEFKQQTSQAQLAQLFADVSPKFQGKVHAVGKSFDKKTGSKDVATIVYTVDTSDAKKYVRVVLVKNESWQVQNFRTSNASLDPSESD